RAAAVELTTIREAALAVEEEEVGRAGGLERLGDLLVLVEQIREVVAGFRGFLLHPIRAVLRKFLDAVGRDGDDLQALRLVLLRVLRKLRADVLHERAVL